MTLSVEVETGRRERTLVVPLSALRAQADRRPRPPCWRLPTAAPQERSVRLGLRTLDAVEVLEGLSAGERVLLRGDRRARRTGAAWSMVPWQPGESSGACADARKIRLDAGQCVGR